MNTRQHNIIRYLDSKRIEKALNGYRYLLDAIAIGLEDKIKLKTISEIYRILAVKHGTKVNGIERGIGYALSTLDISNKTFIVKAVFEIDAYSGDDFVQMCDMI